MGGGGTGQRRGLLAVLCLCLFAALKGLFTPGESRTRAKKILKKMEIRSKNKHHRKFSFSLLSGENGPPHRICALVGSLRMFTVSHRILASFHSQTIHHKKPKFHQVARLKFLCLVRAKSSNKFFCIR